MSRFVVDPDVSQVWIEGSSSVHPVHATATGLTGWVELSRARADADLDAPFEGEIRIAVDRLRSGNGLVDRETRRRIDATHHPEIVGTATAARPVGNDCLAVTGDLSFRGEVRSVEGEIRVSSDGERVVLDGEQSFDVRDWGLQPPRVALLRVHPDVRVRIHVVAEPGR